MKPNDPRLLSSMDNAQAARQRFLVTAQVARERLKPASLKKEAQDKVIDMALDQFGKAQSYARKNPAILATAFSALAALVARRPLGAGMTKLFAFSKALLAQTSKKPE
jgi:hypothetical protein